MALTVVLFIFTTKYQMSKTSNKKNLSILKNLELLNT